MKIKIFILLACVSMNATAQEMWGISNSNFSGNMGIYLNPSMIVGAPYQYEINLVALDQFGENTLTYLPLNEKIVTLGLSDELRTKKLYANTASTLNGFSHELIIGPSYIHNFKDHAWGIHSAYRSGLSTLKMPVDLANLIHQNFNMPQFNGTQYAAGEFTSAYASWFEIGGTYGKVFREDEWNIFKWAATGNILIGDNAYVFDTRNLDYTPVDSQQVIIHQMNAGFAHTVDGRSLGFRGAGLGATIGATYIKNPDRGAFDCNMSNDRLKKYKYRLGVSLLDVGMIRYFNDTRDLLVARTNAYTWNGIDSLGISSPQDLDTALLANLGGTVEENDFNVWLPLAISVQFDYQLRRNLFANATIVNRIHFMENQLARGNQVALSVRYERRRYEAALSFSLYEYKKPSLGLGLRYRFLVIGSDRLLQLVGLSDAPATDLFFGIKFQFCKRPFSPGPDCPAYLSH